VTLSDAAEIKFDAVEWEKTVSEIRGRWEDIKTRTEFGGIVSSIVYADIMEHFAKERGPEGKWTKWSDTYADHMKRIGRAGNKLLQFNGNLRQKFLPQNWKGTSDGILFFNNAQTKSGFPYAFAHDEGGPKLPQRKFMWISPRAMSKILTQTIQWLAEGKEKAGASGAG
jgi:phage gpG-like protein